MFSPNQNDIILPFYSSNNTGKYYFLITKYEQSNYQNISITVSTISDTPGINPCINGIY